MSINRIRYNALPAAAAELRGAPLWMSVALLACQLGLAAIAMGDAVLPSTAAMAGFGIAFSTVYAAVVLILTVGSAIEAAFEDY